MRVIKCIKRVRNSPRVNKIKDIATEVIVWTPILLMVHMQVAVLTYGYYKTDTKRPNSACD